MMTHTKAEHNPQKAFCSAAQNSSELSLFSAQNNPARYWACSDPDERIKKMVGHVQISNHGQDVR
jgi:hypothetical protein